jgi:hypothetical protein
VSRGSTSRDESRDRRPRSATPIPPLSRQHLPGVPMSPSAQIHAKISGPSS